MTNKNKPLPLIADYVPVLQSMVENYHLAGFKSQKITMELITNIGHYMNTQRDKDMESNDNE